jgi:hypothetical protein
MMTSEELAALVAAWLDEGRDTRHVLADALEECGQASAARQVRADVIPRWGGQAFWPAELLHDLFLLWDAEAIRAACLLAWHLARVTDNIDDVPRPRDVWDALLSSADGVCDSDGHAYATYEDLDALRAHADDLAARLADPGGEAGKRLAHLLLFAAARTAAVWAEDAGPAVAAADQEGGA